MTQRLVARWRPQLLVSLLLMVATVAAINSPHASAAFTAPFNLSAPGQDADSAEVAVDPDGDAVAVWQRFDGANFRVQARGRTKTGVLQPVQTLSAAGYNAGDPDVAVDADGDAVVVWQYSAGGTAGVQARARSAGGRLGPIQTLVSAGQNAGRARVAVEPDGDALVVWSRFDGSTANCCYRIQARARSADGTLGRVQTLSDRLANAISHQVAVDADGDALVVWRYSDGSTARVQARARSAGGAFRPVETLSVPGEGNHNPQVAVDAEGNALVVWERWDGTTQCSNSPGCSRIQARARSAEGVLGLVRTLSPAGQDSLDAQVAVDPDGDALVVWGNTDLGYTGVQARARSADGAFGSVQTLSPAGRDAVGAQVAVDGDGNALVVWSGFVHTSFLCCFRVQVRSRSASGVLGPARTVSAARQSAYDPRVAVDQAGNALVAWWRFDGANFRVQGAAGS
jgi:hypothetical protein